MPTELSGPALYGICCGINQLVSLMAGQSVTGRFVEGQSVTGRFVEGVSWVFSIAEP
jgi:hypothetical protein